MLISLMSWYFISAAKWRYQLLYHVMWTEMITWKDFSVPGHIDYMCLGTFCNTWNVEFTSPIWPLCKKHCLTWWSFLPSHTGPCPWIHWYKEQKNTSSMWSYFCFNRRIWFPWPAETKEGTQFTKLLNICPTRMLDTWPWAWGCLSFLSVLIWCFSKGNFCLKPEWETTWAT